MLVFIVINRKIISSKDLTRKLKKELKELFEENDVSFSYLGGSWSIERQTSMSDIDIFVSWPLCDNVSKKTFIELWSHLNFMACEITGLPEIEINLFEMVPLHVQFSIISEGTLIYESSREKRLQFIESILRVYYDYKIWYQNFLNQAIEQLMKNASQ